MGMIKRIASRFPELDSIHFLKRLDSHRNGENEAPRLVLILPDLVRRLALTPFELKFRPAFPPMRAVGFFTCSPFLPTVNFGPLNENSLAFRFLDIFTSLPSIASTRQAYYLSILEFLR